MSSEYHSPRLCYLYLILHRTYDTFIDLCFSYPFYCETQKTVNTSMLLCSKRKAN